MGSLLDKPNTEYIHADEGAANGLKYGVSSMQGWRMEMEDAHTIEPDVDGVPGHSLFAVFDGHGGQNAAIFASERLLPCLTKLDKFKAYVADQTNLELLQQAMQEAFLEVDKEMRVDFQPKSTERSGCTAIAVMVTPTHLVCANAGDSRGLLSRSGKNMELSFDHKPWKDEERDRIEAAGGCVSMKRVDGELAVSRALGDFQYKNEELDPKMTKVTAYPDVIALERVPGEDQFVVLACDGIWDVMENPDVIASVDTYMTKLGEANPRLMAEEMMCECLAKQSRDNMSVVVVLFEAGQAMVAGTGDGIEGLRTQREQALEEGRKAEADAGNGAN